MFNHHMCITKIKYEILKISHLRYKKMLRLPEFKKLNNGVNFDYFINMCNIILLLEPFL